MLKDTGYTSGMRFSYCVVRSPSADTFGVVQLCRCIWGSYCGARSCSSNDCDVVQLRCSLRSTRRFDVHDLHPSPGYRCGRSLAKLTHQTILAHAACAGRMISGAITSMSRKTRRLSAPTPHLSSVTNPDDTFCDWA